MKIKNVALLGGILLIVIISLVSMSFFGKKSNSSNTFSAPPKNQTQSPGRKENSSLPAQNTTTTTKTESSYTLNDVSTHNKANSCWSAINGNVYDLTSFVNRHEGRAMEIMSICGKDGSSAFNSQHGKQGRTQEQISSLIIGSLQQ